MSADVGIDVGLLKHEIRKTYASVSAEPDPDFVFPTGRVWAEDLGIRRSLACAGVGGRVVRRRREPVLAGPAAPGSESSTWARARALTRSSRRRWSVSGARVTGIDMTPEMLAKARSAAAELGAANVEFLEGEAEPLPFEDGSFDVVISNGVMDLIPDKDAVFSELFRVLVPGGRMQIADVTIQSPVSGEGRRNIDLWTG